MKTLVNKINPQIRITAPEIEEYLNNYFISCNDTAGRSLILQKSDWTLVEEEQKHTEVWVEGRTIFEQEGEPEVDLEKATEEYIEKRASLAPNESWDIEDMRDAIRFGAEWQKKQRGKELREKIDEYWNAGYEAGAEWQKKQEPTWKKTEPEPNMSYVLCFKGGGVIDTCDYRERTKRFYYEDGEYNSSVPYNSDTLIGWMYRLELKKLPKQ